MLVDERRHQIAETVLARGAATVLELSDQFHVSQVTIRADLVALERQGTLHRNRGGAVTNRMARFAPAFQETSSVNRDSKKAIAERAASLVRDGDRVLLDSGSTPLYVADHFLKRTLTVAVNSIYTANKLVDAPNVELIHLGGTLHKPALSFAGELAEAVLAEMHFDRLLLGVNGVSTQGISVNNIAELGVKRQMIASASEVIVLADSSKLEINSLARIAPLDAVHRLVTDRRASAAALKRFAKAAPKMEVIRA